MNRHERKNQTRSLHYSHFPKVSNITKNIHDSMKQTHRRPNIEEKNDLLFFPFKRFKRLNFLKRASCLSIWLVLTNGKVVRD